MSRVLFITYNGLTDPLGPSQILPYIRMISNQGRLLHVLSFEKESNDAAATALSAQLSDQGIRWSPLRYTARFGKFGKAWDLMKMYALAAWLVARQRFDVIHCRSLHAAQVGLVVRALCRARVVFDMRGLWVDERIDGGIWSMSRPLDAALYRLYKRVESWALRRSDAVVVLTESVVSEIDQIVAGVSSKITVIPCCADYGHFKPLQVDTKRHVRAGLGIPDGALVVCYLGSLGTWYCLGDMGKSFGRIFMDNPGAWFLFITKDWNDERAEEFFKASKLPDSMRSRVIVRSASRNQVPELLGVADVMLSYIKPAYSKRASSPTKLAEAFASGVPVISNVGVGDVEEITRRYKAGAVVDLSDEQSINAVAASINDVVALGGATLRDRTREDFDVSRAREGYLDVYKRLSLE